MHTISYLAMYFDPLNVYFNEYFTFLLVFLKCGCMFASSTNNVLLHTELLIS